MKSFALSLILTIGCASAAMAVDAPKVSFDATYESSGPAGSTTLHMMSDGKGHMKTETSSHGQNIISIIDYPKMEATTLMVNQKMMIKNKVQETQAVHDAESAKRVHAKDLGSKIVDGHPCHGYEYTSDAGTQTVWVGDDTKYMVHSETVMRTGGKLVTALKAWSGKAPDATAFAIPAGYKEMQIPGNAGMAR